MGKVLIRKGKVIRLTVRISDELDTELRLLYSRDKKVLDAPGMSFNQWLIRIFEDYVGSKRNSRVSIGVRKIVWELISSSDRVRQIGIIEEKEDGF